MGTLYSIRVDGYLICMDLPYDKANLFLKGYVKLELRESKLLDYVKRHYKG